MVSSPITYDITKLVQLSQNSGSSLSTLFTVDPGDNRMLVAIVTAIRTSGSGSALVSSMSYNGKALTQKVHANSGGTLDVGDIWTLANPDVITNGLFSITLSTSSCGIQVGILTLYGVNPNNPIRNTTTLSPAGTTDANYVIDAWAGDLCIAVVSMATTTNTTLTKTARLNGTALYTTTPNGTGSAWAQGAAFIATASGGSHMMAAALQSGAASVSIGMIAFARVVNIEEELSFWEFTYTGDGTSDDSHLIPLPFAPLCVVLKGNTATNGHPMIRTSTMSDSKNMANGTHDQGISSLETAGFRVRHVASSVGRTNESGKTYYGWAIGGSQVEAGSYTVNTTTFPAPRTVSLQDTTAEIALLLLVTSDLNEKIPWRGGCGVGPKSTNAYSDCGGLGGTALYTQAIIELKTGAFVTGTDSVVNTNAEVMHYIAIKPCKNLQVVSFVPGATDNNTEPGLAMRFDPLMITVECPHGVSSDSAFRTAGMGSGDVSLKYSNTAMASDLIQLLSSGAGSGLFQTGGDNIVRSSTSQSVVAFAFIRAVADQSTTPPEPPLPPAPQPGSGKTYAGSSGEAYVTISGILLKAILTKVTPSEIISQIIAGSGDVTRMVEGLSTDLLFIEESTNQLQLEQVIFANTTLQDIIVQLSNLADDNAERAWYAAVWEGRRLHFGPRVIDRVRWHVKKESLGDSGLALERSLENYWSQVQSFYEDSDHIKQSVAPTSDPKFKDNVPVARQKVLDLGSIPLTTTARNAYFEDFKIIQPKTEIQIAGVVLSPLGAPEPLYRVRAGDLIQIDDLLPGRYMILGNAIDPLRTFFIRETTYDAEKNTLQLTPSWPQDRLDVLFANIKQIQAG